jgi:hypothetical protein
MANDDWEELGEGAVLVFCVDCGLRDMVMYWDAPG